MTNILGLRDQSQMPAKCLSKIFHSDAHCLINGRNLTHTIASNAHFMVQFIPTNCVDFNRFQFILRPHQHWLSVSPSLSLSLSLSVTILDWAFIVIFYIKWQITLLFIIFLSSVMSIEKIFSALEKKRWNILAISKMNKRFECHKEENCFSFHFC